MAKEGDRSGIGCLLDILLLVVSAWAILAVNGRIADLDCRVKALEGHAAPPAAEPPASDRANE